MSVSTTPGRITVNRTSPSVSKPPPWLSLIAPPLAAW
jgi:hypothetical protein